MDGPGIRPKLGMESDLMYKSSGVLEETLFFVCMDMKKSNSCIDNKTRWKVLLDVIQYIYI